MDARSIPRAAVSLTLQTWRLPITVTERVTGHAQDESWPPALAFESFEGATRVTVGSLLGDEVLVQQGRLLQARVAELREAARFEARADHERAEADAELQERRRRAEQRRESAEERADQRKQQIEEQTRRERERVEKETRQRKEQAARAEAATKEMLDKKARDARADELDAEVEALDREEQALAARADVIHLDEAIEEQKEARQARRAAERS